MTLLGSHIAVVAAIIGVVGLSYRAPVEATSGKSSAEPSSVLQQPILSVDQIAAADLATNIAQYADMSVQSSVESLSDSLNAKTELAQTDNNFLNKPQIVQLNSGKTIRTYTAVAGDTVPAVAAKFGVSEDTIRWANGLTSDALPAGKQLVILPVTGILYTVRIGDTPGSVATKYQADADRIVAFNDLELSGLNPGQKIIIPDGVLPANERPGYQGSNRSSSVGGSRVTIFAGNRYAYGYCTWYAYNRRAELGRPIGSNWGNAITWATYARQGGWRVDKVPEPGAVFQTNAGWSGFGHVGIVESVNADGSINVSEMNYQGWNVTSGGPHAQRPGRTIPANQVSTYNFIHDRL